MQLAPRDLPDLRHRMLECLFSEFGAYIYTQSFVQTGFIFSIAEDGGSIPVTPAYAQRIYEEESATWGQGTLFYVSEDMTRLARAAGKTLPTFSLRATDLPSPRGVCYFAAPYNMGHFHAQPENGLDESLDLPLHVMTWGPMPVAPELHFSFRCIPDVVKVSFYTTASDDPRTTQIRHVWTGPLISNTDGMLVLGARSDDEQYDATLVRMSKEDDTIPGSLATFVSTVLLMQQKVATEQRFPMERSQRRRASRAGFGVADTRVIHLRSISHSPGGGGGGSYHSRWMVKGHWRNHWYPKQQRHVPTWIAPHVKGPDGAPFKTGEKVYAWTR